jgi:hypothetical protein
MLACEIILPQAATRSIFLIVHTEQFVHPIVALCWLSRYENPYAMSFSKTMPMTEQKKLDNSGGADAKRAEVLKDERLAATVSAYLDGQLMGQDLKEFEALLKTDACLAREVQEMRKIELQLMEMGADILSEPVPDALLEALARLGQG